MTATFETKDTLDKSWQRVTDQVAEAQTTGVDVNDLIRRDAEAHNARAMAIRAERAQQNVFTFSAGDARAALHEKQHACEKLSRMARDIMTLVGLRGGISWIKVTDWLCLKADLTEPRTAVELAAQWREWETR